MERVMKFFERNFGILLSFFTIYMFYHIFGVDSWSYNDKTIFNIGFYLYGAILFAVVSLFKFEKPQKRLKIPEKNNVVFSLLGIFLWIFMILFIFQRFPLNFENCKSIDAFFADRINISLIAFCITAFAMIVFFLPLMFIKTLNNLDLEFFGITNFNLKKSLGFISLLSGLLFILIYFFNSGEKLSLKNYIEMFLVLISLNIFMILTESFFRGYLLNSLDEIYGIKNSELISVLLSAICFTILRFFFFTPKSFLYTPGLLFYYYILGLLNTKLMRKTGNILIPAAFSVAFFFVK